MHESPTPELRPNPTPSTPVTLPRIVLHMGETPPSWPQLQPTVYLPSARARALFPARPLAA